jgi:hypothetical protein
MITSALLGIAMSAFFGGRSECRIRRQAVPVCYTDFLSMYPTVNALLRLWPFHIAARIVTVDATDEVRALLECITAPDLFVRDTWPAFAFYAKIAPDSDVLPVRAQYAHGAGRTIGLNYLTSGTPLWYAGPDLVASKLLTGRSPRILEAVRLVPVGVAPSLNGVSLGGEVPIDPTRDDFFRVVIEERKRLSTRGNLSGAERKRLDKLLKVIANGGGYGIFAEMNRRELPTNKQADLTAYSHDGARAVRSAAPEEPGRFCCPPIAALITAGARLMLALLEKTVTDAGGSYAFCDTDSMAIVATEEGGLVPCEGGALRMPDNRAAILALSWAEVDAIVARFASLSPYALDAVPGSVLKIENYNYADNDDTKERRELQCFVVSAKRYSLFVLQSDSQPSVVKSSEHGLGALLNPLDPNGTASRRWVDEFWTVILCRALNYPYVLPEWYALPALSRLAISKAALLAPFATANRKKSYDDQIKPYNFLICAHVAAHGHPQGVDPHRFHLVAPYERRPAMWLKAKWVDRYSGRRFHIRTGLNTGLASQSQAFVSSYAGVLQQYETHPEPKSAAPGGGECTRDTRGILGRRHVTVRSVEV